MHELVTDCKPNFLNVQNVPNMWTMENGSCEFWNSNNWKITWLHTSLLQLDDNWR